MEFDPALELAACSHHHVTTQTGFAGLVRRILAANKAETASLSAAQALRGVLGASPQMRVLERLTDLLRCRSLSYERIAVAVSSGMGRTGQIAARRGRYQDYADRASRNVVYFAVQSMTGMDYC